MPLCLSFPPNTIKSTFSSSLSHCRSPSDPLLRAFQDCTQRKDLASGRRCYDLLVKGNLEADSFWSDQLIRLFASCGDLIAATRVFENVPKPSIYTWNAIISAHVQLDDAWGAIRLYRMLQLDELRPDRLTYLWLIKACTISRETCQGRILQIQIIDNGLGADGVLQNTIINLFAKCGSLDEAQRVFDKMLIRDQVSWASLLAGYVQHGHPFYALKLYESMQEQTIQPDRVILLCITKAIACIGAVKQGRIIHHEVVKNGLELDVAIGSCLVHMYGKCGSTDEAKIVFVRLPERNVVAWSALVVGFLNQGDDLMVLDLYEQMQQEDIPADRVMYLCVLKTCSNLGALYLGRVIENLLRTSNIKIDVILGTALIEMYVYCGHLNDAYKIITNLHSRNNVSWSAMITGFAVYGDGMMIDKSLEEMRKQGLRPDEMVFTQILTSCSHSGLLDLGRCCFNSLMIDHGVMPTLEHFTCMVDLLGRAGYLGIAENLVESMPMEPDDTVWRSLLFSCEIYCNFELGKRCFSQLSTPDSNDEDAYMSLSQMYTISNMLEDVDGRQQVRFQVITSPIFEEIRIHSIDQIHELQCS